MLMTPSGSRFEVLIIMDFMQELLHQVTLLR